MRAAVVTGKGGPEVLAVTQVPEPRPRNGEVLVAVKAAGVTASDRILRRTGVGPRVVRWLRGAAITGLELAGTVIALGPGARRWAIGQAVYGAIPGSLNGGTYAEQVALKEAWLAPKPALLSFEEAATVPVGAMTALAMVDGLARVRSGQRVLINGAGGGIGIFATQLARIRGCDVTALCAADDVARVGSLGADRALDYRTTDLAQLGRFEGVLDMVGMPFAAAKAVTRRGGAYVSPVFNFGTLLRLRRLGVRAHAAMVRPATAALQQLAELFDQGALRVTVDRVFSLEEAGSAQAYYFEGKPRGRVAIRVA